MSNKPWEGGSFSQWPTIRGLDGYRLAQELMDKMACDLITYGTTTSMGGERIDPRSIYNMGPSAISEKDMREIHRAQLRRDLYHFMTPEMRRYLPPPEPMSADEVRRLSDHYLHSMGIPKEWVQAEPKEEDNIMNLKNAVYLIRDDIVTVVARGPEDRKLTLLCEQDLAKQLSAALGDKKHPIVVARGGSSLGADINTMGLLEVLEVHAEPVIDVNYKGVYRYVVGMVDASDVLEREKEDAKMHTMLKRKQQSSAREQVLAGLGIGDRKEFLEHVRSTVDAVESDDNDAAND